jgi:phosphoribosylformylglycinamidine (FGAM) synthase-like enzyme
MIIDLHLKLKVWLLVWKTFGSSPKTIMTTNIVRNYSDLEYNSRNSNVFRQVFQLEAVACKDWLTNKVDRCVGGKVANNNVLVFSTVE